MSAYGKKNPRYFLRKIRSFFSKKRHTLIRNLLLLGAIAFVGYCIGGHRLFLLVIGPPIFLANIVKKIIILSGAGSLFAALPPRLVNDYLFLMPVTLLYFASIGFLIKQLQKEQGIIRPLSIFVFTIFLFVIHYKAWNYLTGYFIPNS